ncbi:hypothetical protein T439DRAFT_326242 [Meredithblackwellia eburnea MCA 4105]
MPSYEYPRSPSMKSTKSSRKSLAASFRTLIGALLFDEKHTSPILGGPEPFDMNSISAAMMHQGSGSSHGSESSGGSSELSYRTASSDFSSSSYNSSTSSSSSTSEADQNQWFGSPEGHWVGEGASRRWVASPFSSPFPQSPRPASFVDITSFTPNSFRFAATFTQNDGFNDDPLTVVDEEEDIEHDYQVKHLQQSFARSEQSHRRRGAISSASISLPAARNGQGVVFPFGLVDEENSLYDEHYIARFMGLQLNAATVEKTTVVEHKPTSIAATAVSSKRKSLTKAPRGAGVLNGKRMEWWSVDGR